MSSRMMGDTLTRLTRVAKESSCPVRLVTPCLVELARRMTHRCRVSELWPTQSKGFLIRAGRAQAISEAQRSHRRAVSRSTPCVSMCVLTAIFTNSSAVSNIAASLSQRSITCFAASSLGYAPISSPSASITRNCSPINSTRNAFASIIAIGRYRILPPGRRFHDGFTRGIARLEHTRATRASYVMECHRSIRVSL